METKLKWETPQLVMLGTSQTLSGGSFHPTELTGTAGPTS